MSEPPVSQAPEVKMPPEWGGPEGLRLLMRNVIDDILDGGEGVTLEPQPDGTIKIIFTPPASTDAEIVRDVIGTALIAGEGLTKTVDDAADTITLELDPVAPGNTGGTAFYLDPHLPPFNAYGDAVAVNNALIFDDAGTLKLEFPGTLRPLDAATDIGMPVWLPDGAARTILAIDANNRATLDVAPPGWMAGQTINVIIGHDDTAALQAALDAANALQVVLGENPAGWENRGTARGVVGGVVRLKAGAGYIIHNPQADFLGGKHGALELPRRTGLVGGGIGQTSLYIATGTYGHGITLKGRDVYSDFCLLGGFSLWCFGDINGNQLDGINMDWAFDGYPNTDAFTRFHDIAVHLAGRNGFMLNGRGEAVFERLQAEECQWCGIFANGMTDSMFYRCSAGGNRKTGIRVRNSGPTHWVMCKSYYNGSNGTAVFAGGNDAAGVSYPPEHLEGNCANWWLETGDWDFGGAVLCTSCESQESVGSGWVIESGENQFVSCRAADPGRTSYGPPQANRPANIAGFHLRGMDCHNNTFAGCLVTSELGRWDAQNYGFANGAVRIEGIDANGRGPVKNKGDIAFMEGFTKRDLVAWVPNWNGGPVDGRAGPGWTNAQNTKLALNGVAGT